MTSAPSDGTTPGTAVPDAPARVVDLTDGAPHVVDLRDGARGTHATAGTDGRPGGPEDAAPEETGPAVHDLPGGVRAALEAVLMVADEPVPEPRLAAALDVPVAAVARHLAELALEYTTQQRGFVLRRVAGGWRVFSSPDHAEVVHRFLLDGQTSKLSQAALETLAIVAYRQPVSRARVGAIRGVNVDAVMRTLVARGMVEESGQDRETGAILYRTTDLFLQKIGLTTVEDLPDLAPFLPGADMLDELAGTGAL